MRRLTILKSKIHRATVTDSSVDYVGSISIDKKLLEAANIHPYEKVLVANISNGERFETYAIPNVRGTICVNGAAARLVQIGDKIIIMCFCDIPEEELNDEYKPILVFVDDENELTLM